MKAVKVAISVAVVLSAVVAIRRVSYLPAECNSTIAVTVARLDRMSRQANDTQMIGARENIDRLAPCRTGMPWNVETRVLTATNYAILGNDEEALRIYKDALRVDRRSEIYYNVGVELLKLGRVDEAMEPLTIGCLFDTTRLAALPDDVRQRVIDRMLLRWSAK